MTNGGSGAPNNFLVPRDTPDSSNGGNGGSIQLVANNQIENTGRIVSDGGAAGVYNFSYYGFNGGSGGLISLKAGSTIQNDGVIRAMGTNGSYLADDDLPEFGGAGGNGGKVIFQFPGNSLLGNGVVATLGGLPTHIGNEPSNPTYDGAYGKLGSITVPNPGASTNKLFGVWIKSP